jgi:AcrR family transcriptional regulator
MEKGNPETLSRILQVGKEEFLKNGFRGASLRVIAKNAGVTTGAIFGYYADKKALFDVLVSDCANTFRNQFVTIQNDFDELPTEQQMSDMNTYTSEALQGMLDYIYENFDIFKLILCHSAGTDYEDYVDSLVEIEIESTTRFMDRMRAAGHPMREISTNLNHILANAYFSAIFETITHDMPKAEADAYVASLSEFFHAGWAKLIGQINTSVKHEP